jgi:hypothetical protein
MMEHTVPTPADVREEVRAILKAAEKESAIEVKRALARRAFKLAQLAEKLEREEAMMVRPLR